MDPGARTWKEKGNHYYKSKRFREALECYSEAIRIDPRYSDAWFNLGMTCRALGYEAESRACFEKARIFRGSTAESPSAHGSAAAATRVSVGTGDRSSSGTKKSRKPAEHHTGGKIPVRLVAAVIILVLASIVAFSFLSSHSVQALYNDRSGSSASAVFTPEITPGPALNQSSLGIRDPPGSANLITPEKYAALKTGAISRSFPYVLRGTPGTVNMTLYRGVYDRIAGEDPYTYVGKTDRYQKFVDLPMQDPFLEELVVKIREKSSNPDDQVRIAVSLVQEIPYDDETFNTRALEVRYPYMTLYDDTGVCCEKSVLLAYLLRELGYGVAVMDFEREQHTVVGILVSPSYDYRDTGYAFVETTTPQIMTYGNGDYPSFGKITSPPEVLPVADGNTFVSVNEEANDASEWNRLNSLGPVLDRPDYSRWQALCKKYGIVPDSA